MVVSISFITGAHMLDLARQMASRHLLGKYYTTLPPSRTPRLPAARTRRHLALTPFVALGMRGWLPMSDGDYNWTACRAFDRWVARRLEPCDIIHCPAAYALETLRVGAARVGAIGICDSGTSHVTFQQQIMREECARWNVASAYEDPRFSDRVLEEYDAASLIMVPSTFARNTFLASGIAPEKIAVAPYSADQVEYRPVGRNDDVFRILFVGSLSIRKGLPYLIEAVSRLGFRNAELTLVGPPAAETAAILARYRGSVPLSIPGPQRGSRTRMKEVFSRASVLVLPSIEDGFGLVIPQAMACGVPVIASSHTGGPDLITDGVEGFVVAPRDVNALEQRLTALYEEPEQRDAMAAAALRRISSTGGWNVYGDAAERAYRAVLDRDMEHRASVRCVS